MTSIKLAQLEQKNRLTEANSSGECKSDGANLCGEQFDISHNKKCLAKWFSEAIYFPKNKKRIGNFAQPHRHEYFLGFTTLAT